MKKILCSGLLVVLIISALAIATSAATVYSGTYTVDFSSSYVMKDSTKAITMRYNYGGLVTDVRASTDISYSTDATYVYSYVKVTALNNETSSSYSQLTDPSTSSSSVLNSGKASVSGQNYAKEVRHYANRTLNGLTSFWDYYCE
ncbi:MAG: hypothetical protein LUD44_01790 [Firmicutes bacterium]|nr:hypothetical protein [Bacillota bacterium]